MKEYPKKFIYKDFSCDIKVFHTGNEYIVKFFDQSKDIPIEKMINAVFADQGFGYISFIEKNEDTGLASGFLDGEIFKADLMISEAVNFVTKILGHDESYVPYHVEIIKKDKFLEHNGEY